MDFGIEVATRGDDTVLTLAGDIDMHTAPEVRDCLAGLQADGVRSVVVDLAAVTFLDSSALGTFVVAHRALAGVGGQLKLAAPSSHVRKVLRITRLAEVIPLYESVDEACA